MEAIIISHVTDGEASEDSQSRRHTRRERDEIKEDKNEMNLKEFVKLDAGTGFMGTIIN